MCGHVENVEMQFAKILVQIYLAVQKVIMIGIILEE